MKHLFVVRTGLEPVYGILSFIITTGEGHIGLCSLTSTIPSPDYICSGFERINASLSLLLYIFRYLVTAGTTTSTSIIIRAGFEPGTVQDGLSNHLTGLGNRPLITPT